MLALRDSRAGFSLTFRSSNEHRKAGQHPNGADAPLVSCHHVTVAARGSFVPLASRMGG